MVAVLSVVFMGSEKYPDENDFDAYVKQYGGNSNAYTECENVSAPCLLYH